MQTSGWLKALRELESTGHIDLPKAQHKTGTKSPHRLTTPMPLPVEVKSIVALELLQVRETEQMRIWCHKGIKLNSARSSALNLLSFSCSALS